MLLPASLLPSVARLLHPYVLAALLSHAPTHRRQQLSQLSAQKILKTRSMLPSFTNDTATENYAGLTRGVDTDAKPRRQVGCRVLFSMAFTIVTVGHFKLQPQIEMDGHHHYPQFSSPKGFFRFMIINSPMRNWKDAPQSNQLPVGP
ncbi:hypothetical protein B0H13DRAFT_1925261 [Mycena leptocephala]|nr:hypothetical protein B0H13DRAFT_1925261 [Mycena leptocephala]